MWIFTPLIAAVLQAASYTCDKAILNIRRIDYKFYTAVSFPMLACVDVAIWFIFRPTLNLSMFGGTTGLLVAGTVAMLIITNLLYYRALDHTHVSEINVLSLTSVIPVMLVNALIFADERQLVILIPALIAAAAVVWSHWERSELRFARHTPAFLMWLWFSAPLVAASAKVILTTWSPIALELVRDASIALILLPLFWSSIRAIPIRGWFLFVVTNVLSATGWILYFYGYQHIGIVYTGLLFTLQPLLVYFSGVLLLKEPFVLKKFIAFLVVLASITATQVMR